MRASATASLLGKKRQGEPIFASASAANLRHRRPLEPPLLEYSGGSLKQSGDTLAADVALWLQGGKFWLDKVEHTLK